jgi:hypothetical protein
MLSIVEHRTYEGFGTVSHGLIIDEGQLGWHHLLQLTQDYDLRLSWRNFSICGVRY